MKYILSVLAVCLCTISYGQQFSKLDKSPLDMVYYPLKAPKLAAAKSEEERLTRIPKIRVIYSRPQKKERNIFGDVVPFDKLWRIGANENVEVLFFTDVKFGDTKVEAGRYSMAAYVTADQWEMKLNKVVDTWGVYTYDESKEVASVKVPTRESEKVIEPLSITFYEKSKRLVHMKIGWDKTVVEIPIQLL